MSTRQCPTAGGAHGPVGAHERRGHWRRYRDERYSEETRSRPQWIEATWVGPSEAEVGAHRYRVRLDL